MINTDAYMSSMEWNKLFNKNNNPDWGDISSYIDNSLWGKLNNYLQHAYEIKPELSYSNCSAQPGWNIKYKKSAKSLCTLYPEKGYFIALIVIGNKEELEADLMAPRLTKYVEELYRNTRSMKMGRWLMINVTDEDILEDVISLIKLRVKPKAK